jgi:hypothetical protein
MISVFIEILLDANYDCLVDNQDLPLQNLGQDLIRANAGWVETTTSSSSYCIATATVNWRRRHRANNFVRHTNGRKSIAKLAISRNRKPLR